MNIYEENNAMIGVCPIMCYKATVTKNVWYWHQNKQMNGTELKGQEPSEVQIQTNLV